jgi:hypothetical protein
MTIHHSKLPPSSAARRMACPGSRALEERYGRKQETEASNEGTKAHELAAKYLRESSIVGVLKPEGYTDEMSAGAWYYQEVVTRFVPLENLHIEERIDCSNIHPEMWGTADAWGVHDSTLHVFDYKFGYTPVEAFENWQLVSYACGLTQKVFFDKVCLHIVQPRDYVSSSRHKIWSLTLQELKSYHNRLLTSESLAMSPTPELRVSDQCKYCSARHACPALRSAAFGAAEIAHRDVPRGLDPASLGNELKLLHEAQDLLDFRITALETEAQHLLQAGKSVDHYELKPVEGRMNWNVDKQTILNMGLVLGFDLRKPDDVITPTQAIEAGLPKETVLKYAERKQSLKLSKIDINRSKAVFKKQ